MIESTVHAARHRAIVFVLAMALGYCNLAVPCNALDIPDDLDQYISTALAYYGLDTKVLRYEPYIGGYILSSEAGSKSVTYYASYDSLHFDEQFKWGTTTWSVKGFRNLTHSGRPSFGREGTLFYHNYIGRNGKSAARRCVVINPLIPSRRGLNLVENNVTRGHGQPKMDFSHHPHLPFLVTVQQNGSIDLLRDDEESQYYNVGRTKTDDVTTSVMNADGDLLVVVTESRRVEFFDCSRLAEIDSDQLVQPLFELLREIVRPKNSVKILALHPDGRRVVSCGKDKSITIWDIETGEDLISIPFKGDIRCLSLSPDGGIIAVGDDKKTVHLLAMEDGRTLVRKEFDFGVHALEFHPLGFALLAAVQPDRGRGYHTVYRFDLTAIPEIEPIVSAWHTEALSNATIVGNTTAAGLSLVAIRHIEISHAKRVASLNDRLASRIEAEATPGPKDEFENKAEYAARVEQTSRAKSDLQRDFGLQKEAVVLEAKSEIHRHLDKVFSFRTVKVELGQFNAEKNMFSAKIHAAFLGQMETLDIQFKLDRKEARSLKTNWNKVEFVGQGRLRSSLVGSQPKKPRTPPALFQKDRFDLVKLEMRDPVTKSFYAIDLASKKPVYAVETSSPGLPPDLVATVIFEEPSGNDILDPEEEGTVWIEVENRGTGSAFDTSVEITPRSLEHMTYSPAHFGEVAPGEKRRARMPLWADLDLQEGACTMQFSVRSAEGFAAPPVKLTFQTNKYSPPQLELADVGVEDWSNNGRIEPGEQATVTARIQNMGYGHARDVHVKVNLGQHVVFASGESGIFKLGRLDPGEYRDVRFQIYTNTDAVALPISIDLREGTGRASKEGLSLDLAFDVPLRAITEVIVAGKADKVRRTIIREQGLSVDVDENIPHTDMKNPDAVAVILGVFEQKYADVPQVRYAKRDAYAVRDYLINTLGYAPQNILPQDPNELMSAGAMKALIKDQLPSTIKEGRSDVFVYYSGHGAPSTNTQEAFLVPWDCDPNRLSEHNSYNVNEFQADLAAVGARSLVLVIDACFSGQIGNGQPIVTNVGPVLMKIENPFVAKEGMVVFASSAPEQVSNWYPAKRHGMFTYFFLKGLQGSGDLDGDGHLTVKELESFLVDANEGVPYWSKREFQRPQTPIVVGDRSVVLVDYQ